MTFDITQWADHLRGLTDQEVGQTMEEHLALDPSSPAHREVRALERVMQLAETDRELDIPDYALRCAKALGSLQRPQTIEEPSLLDRLVMALTFDSQIAPAMAGTRDMAPSHRRMTFESADFGVDLRLEADPEGSVVVGQIWQGSGDDAEPVADVPVLAMNGRSVVAQSVTNPYGEFQADGLPDADLALVFLVDDQHCLEVSLAPNA
ncbi:MAG: hypothetical protein AAGE94_15800 [Acidobacteriota bacterium]